LKNIVKFKFEKRITKTEVVLKLNSLKEIEKAKLNKSPIKILVTHATGNLGFRFNSKLALYLEDVANPKTGLNSPKLLVAREHLYPLYLKLILLLI
jgi:hypothetical protein